jgi:hypothetical protein
LYRYVPEFDSVRVTARYAMFLSLFLAVLGGFGAALIGKRKWIGTLMLAALGLIFLGESVSTPVPMYTVFPEMSAELPTALGKGAMRPYGFVKTLPSDAVLIEFPMGRSRVDPSDMFASTRDRRALVQIGTERLFLLPKGAASPRPPVEP